MNAMEELLLSFDEEKRVRILSLFEKYRLSASNRLTFLKDTADLELFLLPSPFEILDFEKIDKLAGKQRGDELMRELGSHMQKIRHSETDYSDFFPPSPKKKRTVCSCVTDESVRLMGRCPCPVDGEKTRCCNLKTLDAATQCAFGCSYCSVQSFYSESKISTVSNLSERLKGMDFSGVWHIGTGQASDSLLLGDDYGTLSAIKECAEEHPEIIFEMKSKSKRTDFLGTLSFPQNVVFTWSVNARTMIEKEEHLTARLHERLQAARRVADKGLKVGFHIHPMAYFKGWQDEYRELVLEIERNFRPEEVVMVGIGTLTFTKAVIRRLRTHRFPSRVLSMPLVESAGKHTYTNEIKKKMFSHVYDCFSDEYKENVFFYLCMEDPTLWMPVLKREYGSDKEFEADMRRSYYKKIWGSEAPSFQAI